MTKFNIGDKVKLSRSARLESYLPSNAKVVDNFNDLEWDRLYTVVGQNHSDVKLDGVISTWDENRFELVSRPQPTTTTKLCGSTTKRVKVKPITTPVDELDALNLRFAVVAANKVIATFAFLTHAHNFLNAHPGSEWSIREIVQ